MHKLAPNLVRHQEVFLTAKDKILLNWLSHDAPKQILELHQIDRDSFLTLYGSGVFDYFMDVIASRTELGNCPVMNLLLVYLKERETSADEVFELCSHFRKTMIDFSYDAEIGSREITDEISFIFDTNFKGVLTFYTNSIFEKLVDARQEALNASKAKEYFLSNMSHEIRTPLNAILGFVNLMLSEEITPKQEKYLDIIENSGENLLSLINDILDFSKLRSGEFTIEAKNFLVHDEISHTLELFVGSATNKDITITSYIDPAMPKELFADSLRVKQIVSNFLSNAIKFSHFKGNVHVECSYHEKILKLEVKDDGVGIEQKDIDNIFVAFAQAELTEVNTYAGTGLGLSISKQLAELMEGKIYVSSKVGVGSCFTLEVPVETYTSQSKKNDIFHDMQNLRIGLYSTKQKQPYQFETLQRYMKSFEIQTKKIDTLDQHCDIYVFIYEDQDEILKKALQDTDKKYIALMSKDYDTFDIYPNVSSIPFPLYCSKLHQAFETLLYGKVKVSSKEKLQKQFVGHILVAEDNEPNQEYIKIILSKYGLTYDVVSNGMEAVEYYKKYSYDLILMDEQMPLMGGKEAVAKIIEYEEKNALRHTPISALTANVIKGAKERGLLSGFDAFLGKPIVIKELERVLSSYLKSVENFGEIVLDDIENYQRVIGIDMQKAREELLLTNEEIVMLITLFISKMKKLLPELENAIEKKDFSTIRKLAHNIKGSSANFRLETLQALTAELEKMAQKEKKEYDFMQAYKNIEAAVSKIKIL